MRHGVFTAATLAALALAAPTTLTPAGKAIDNSYVGCFMELAPISAGAEASEVIQKDCFTDEQEAIAFRDDLHSLDGVYVLFTIWEYANFGGSSYEWYSTTSCEGDYGYNDFNVIGWNDRASSARAGCGRTVELWEHTYQMGSSLQISGYSSSLGIMDDESSSWDMADYN